MLTSPYITKKQNTNYSKEYPRRLPTLIENTTYLITKARLYNIMEHFLKVTTCTHSNLEITLLKIMNYVIRKKINITILVVFNPETTII